MATLPNDTTELVPAGALSYTASGMPYAANSNMTEEEFLAALANAPRVQMPSITSIENYMASSRNAGLPSNLQYTPITQTLNPNYDPTATFSLPPGSEFTMTDQERQDAYLNWLRNTQQYQTKSWMVNTDPTGYAGVHLNLQSGSPYVLRNNETGEIIAQGSDDATLERIAGLISSGSLGDKWQLFEPSQSSYGNLTAGLSAADAAFAGNTGYGNSEYVEGKDGQPGYWLNPIGGAKPAPSLAGQLAMMALKTWGLPVAGAYLGPALSGALNVSSGVGAGLAGAVTGAAGSAVSGGDILKGALLGGAASLGLNELAKAVGPGALSGGGGSSSSGGGGGSSIQSGFGPEGITAVGYTVPTFTPPIFGGLAGSPDYQEQQAAQQEAQNEGALASAENFDPREIVAVGNTGAAGGLNMASAISPAVAQLGLDIATNPAKYEQEIKDAQEDADQIKVIGAPTNNTFGVTLPAGVTTSTGPSVPTSVNTDEIVVSHDPVNKNVVSVPINGLISTSGNDVPTSVNTDEIVVKGDAKTDPNAAVTLPTNALTGDPIGTEGTKSTLDKVIDYLKAAGLGVGLLGNLGGGSGGGSGTMPGGMGARSPIYSATLPTPGQNGAFAVGGLDRGTGTGGIGGVTPPGGDYTRFGMGSATRAAPSNIPQYGGVNPPGFNTQTWEWLGPQTGVAKDITDQLAVLPSSAAPAQPEKKAMGGYAVGGPGDGRSDEIPAMLSDGEYVIDAETVALLGNGSNKAGAQQLDKFRANIRKHKGRELARGQFSVKAKAPDAYLPKGRS